MQIIIQQAMPEEAGIIAPLFNKYRTFYEQPEDIEGATKFIEDRLLHNESVIFIAYEDEKAIGFTQLYPIFTSVGMQKTWILNDLFVDEKCRNRGVGNKLMDAAVQHAKLTNSKWLMLQTQSKNEGARKLYEQYGWKQMDDVFFSIDV